MPRQPTRADLLAEVARLDEENGRLERAASHLVERNRSLAILLERAEADRDAALSRLAACAEENARKRHLLIEARASIARLEGVAP